MFGVSNIQFSQWVDRFSEDLFVGNDYVKTTTDKTDVSVTKDKHIILHNVYTLLKGYITQTI